MSAPETAYHTEKANFDTTTTEVDVYIAKFLENTTPPTGDDWGDGYFNSTDDDATRKSKILSIFKLDGLFRGKTTLKEGFIGYVKISPTPSDNSTYHASGRFSGRKLTDQTTGYTYELLNDGGLNTKPFLTVNTGIDNTKSDLANNGFKITLDYRSAYHIDTSSYGIRWRKQGDTTYNTVDLAVVLGIIGKKIKVSLTDYVIDVDPLDILYVEAPYTYEILAFITNTEGTKEFQMNNVTIIPIELSLAFGTTPENAYLYGTTTSYYMSRRIAEGATLYSNSIATIPVVAGFYMDKSGTAPYLYYECDSNGVILGFAEYNPLVQRVLYEPSGWGSTEVNAISDANSTSWIPKYTIYFDPNDNLWYADNMGITLANDGYWLVGDSEFSYESIYLINGVQQT
jgi:hypothetical protein